MAEPDHYREAADGLETAAKALRACAQEEAADEAEETPVEKQPKTLRAAAGEARRRFRPGRSGDSEQK